MYGIVKACVFSSWGIGNFDDPTESRIIAENTNALVREIDENTRRWREIYAYNEGKRVHFLEGVDPCAITIQ